MFRDDFTEAQFDDLKSKFEAAGLSQALEFIVRERVVGLIAQIQVDLKAEFYRHEGNDDLKKGIDLASRLIMSWNEFPGYERATNPKFILTRDI